MRLAFATACVIMTMATPVLAEDCETYGFEGSENYNAAKVKKSAGKARFRAVDDTEQGAYLLPGDEVVVLSQQGDLSCVVYVSAKYDQTIGWMKSSELSPLPPSEKPSDWRGTFVRDQLGSTAVLKPLKQGKVEAMVEAYWAMSLETAETGGANQGGIGGEFALEDGALYIPPEPADNNNCEANLRRIGTRYLLVEDNRDRLNGEVLTCAGHNVTFTGLYVRTK